MWSPKIHHLIVAVAVGLNILATGCGTQGTDLTTYTFASGTVSTASAVRDAAKRDCALVRFVHAYNEGGAQELFFGGLRAFPNVAYKTVTPYVELPGERRDFKLFKRSSDALHQLTSNNEGLWEGRRYTVVSSSRPDGSPMIQAFHDELTAPSSGKARIRVIHVSPSMRQIDISNGSDRVFTGVNFREATTYTEISPGKAALLLHRAGEKSGAYRIPKTEFVSGRSYTFIVTGGLRTAKSEIIRIEDGFVAAPPASVSSLLDKERSTGQHRKL